MIGYVTIGHNGIDQSAAFYDAQGTVAPIFVGYAIPQLSTRIPAVVADLKKIYEL